MSKFKVGEKVWVKPRKEIKDRIGSLYFALPMNEYCGMKEIVGEICGHKEYRLKDVDHEWIWAEDWFESEEEHQLRVNGEKKEEQREESKMQKLKDLRPGTMFHSNCYKGSLVKASATIAFFIVCVKMDDGTLAVIDGNEYVEVDIPVPLEPVEKLDVLATQALEHWGDDTQIRQTMEECAELIVVLNKALRYPEQPEKDVLEEIADVTIMVEQMKQIFDKNLEFDDILKVKMNKLRKYMEEKAE